MTRFAFTVPLLFALGVACGGDDDGPLDIDALCSADDGLFLELIDKTLECNPALTNFFLPVLPSPADLAAICDHVFGDQLEDGTVTFGKKSAAQACRDAIDSSSCEEFDIDLIPECDDLLIGTLATGDVCDVNAQCIGDAYCDRGDDDACGACVNRLADGASCDNDDACQSHHCTNDGECLSPAGAGADCTVDDDCLGSLMCNRHLGECQSTADWTVGDACAPETNDCWPFENGIYCDGQTEECVAFLSIGDDCGAMTAACDFIEGEHCDFGASGTCVGATEFGEGQACNLFLGQVCDDGLLCSGIVSGTCIEPAEPGDECISEDAAPCPGALLLECVQGICQYGDSHSTCEL